MESARRLSSWLLSRAPQSYARVGGHRTTDVIIIGGGITGLTTAALLKQRGFQVVVLEAHRLAEGATGYTSAHLTTAFERSYVELARALGIEPLRQLVAARRQSIEAIARLAHTYDIDCDFQSLPGYWTATTPEQMARLRDELEVVRAVDATTAWSDDVPNGLGLAAIRFAEQAAFDPVQYVRGLARVVHGDGSVVFENSPVVAVEDGERVTVRTADAELRANAVVLATHTPIGRNVVHAEMVPYRSYVASCELAPDAAFPRALIWDLDTPYHYARPVRSLEGEPLVLIGGNDHKTGETHDTHRHYAELEAFARTRYGIREVNNAWSTELFETCDGLPFIGASPGEKNVWIACGYGGDGLTWGTLAAHVLTDAIAGTPHALATQLSPTRLPSLSGSKRLIADNLHIAAHFVKDRLRQGDIASVHDLKPGHGALVTIGGHKIAAFRETSGTLHTFSAACTHMKCIVQWNKSEQTWDCPCHGGRFSATGAVISAPPTKPLTPVDIEAGKKDR